MKNIMPRLFTLVVLSFFLFRCQPQKKLLFDLPDKRPVYSIQVADATEVDLLRQQLNLPIFKVSLPNVFFHADNIEINRRLSELGYDEPKLQNAEEIYLMYAKITGKADEESMKRNAVEVLNVEKDHSVIYGSIASLKALRNSGFKLSRLDYEPKPRTVEIKVPREADIQVVAGMQVDIFSASPDNNTGYIIRGAAWDKQIGELRKLNFTVTII